MSASLFPSIVLPAYSLWHREIVRFYRQRSRVIGAIVPPLIFWFLIGSGLGDSFRLGGLSGEVSGGMSYLHYFFPGTIVMIVLFTSIFSTISVIEDRKEGFMQSVQIAPISRLGIVFGKVLGGATLAFLQALVFLLIAPAMGITFRLESLAFILVVLFIVSFGLTGLGFLIAWRMDSTQGFHSIMNLFLMPMWFLSGALFPLETAPSWLRWVMVADPLTYSVAALRYGFYADSVSAVAIFPSPLLCVIVSILFCVLTFSVSVAVVSRGRKAV